MYRHGEYSAGALAEAKVLADLLHQLRQRLDELEPRGPLYSRDYIRAQTPLT